MNTVAPDAELNTRIAEIKQRFAAEDHVLTIQRDDGLYRHLVIEKPKSPGTRCEVVTWPGALAITGYTGSHILRRDDDMIAFFRTCMSSGIAWDADPRFWAEKVQPHGADSGLVLSYAGDRVVAHIKEAAAEAEADYPGLVAEVEEKLLSRYSTADLDTEGGVKAALDTFEFEGFRFDYGGWEFTEYTYWFLYTCQVIAWTVAQYDAALVPTG
ncbi:hypothetical protein [Streptomyces microflavus]|uniref:hypothetical protein n=1 Tax=Streptomyces microflavus TaxID=1919 RepID=UPI0034078122